MCVKAAKAHLCEQDEFKREICFVKAFAKSTISHFIRHCECDRVHKIKQKPKICHTELCVAK